MDCMNPVLDKLHTDLVNLPPGMLHVGFSGGLDSSVLLHALAQLPDARERSLTALHVNHGMHAESGDWAEQCRVFAASLSIDCNVITANVKHNTGLGPEAAARAARYAAFAERLPAGAILALAHHREDQSETVLLKLLRGAGPEGIGGMRDRRSFSTGLLWRPLLALPRATLRAYADAQALTWIDDPSNVQPYFARNFLRQNVLPMLRTHWPNFDNAFGHAAHHARAAADFIGAEAEKALARVQGLDPATLRWREWLGLPEALRDPVLRRWLRALGLDEPTHLHATELEHQLGSAASERLPCIRFARTELRRYRDLLYAIPPLPAPPTHWMQRWNGQFITLPIGGTIALVDAHGVNTPLDEPLTLGFRRGGETLRPRGDPHTRELRDLFQRAGIPPWQRGYIPLIYLNGALGAVGDLWLDEMLGNWLDRNARRIDWRPLDQPARTIDRQRPLR